MQVQKGKYIGLHYVGTIHESSRTGVKASQYDDLSPAFSLLIPRIY